MEIKLRKEEKLPRMLCLGNRWDWDLNPEVCLLREGLEKSRAL